MTLIIIATIDTGMIDTETTGTDTKTPIGTEDIEDVLEIGAEENRAPGRRSWIVTMAISLAAVGTELSTYAGRENMTPTTHVTLIGTYSTTLVHEATRTEPDSSLTE